MTIKLKQVPSIAIIAVISCLSIALLVGGNSDSHFGVQLMFCLIVAVCTAGFLLDARAFSMNKTFWLFSLVFMGFAPFVQYNQGTRLWGFTFSDADYLKTNATILLGFLVYILVRILFRKTHPVSNVRDKAEALLPENLSFKCRPVIYLLLAVLSFTALGMLVGFTDLFFRDANAVEAIDSSVLRAIVNYSLRATPVFCFVYTYFSKTFKYKKLVLLFEFLIVLCCNFPTSTTRFWMGAVFLGLFLLWLAKKQTGHIYEIVFLVVFFFVFPLFSLFKSVDVVDFSFDLIKDFSVYDGLASVDFDAYSVLSRSILYVEGNGSVMGAQIVGTMLFFIPRSIWTGKPEATGAFLAREQGQWYTNISAPLFAEGMVNFGYFGVVLFAALFSFAVAFIDHRYWESGKAREMLKTLYPFLIGFTIFLLRGAIHHAVVYLFIFCIPAVAFYIFNRMKLKQA